MECLYHTSPFKALRSMWKKGQKDGKIWVVDNFKETTFSREQDRGTNEPTAIVTAYIKPWQAQAAQNPSLEEGKESDVPPQVWSDWEKESHFSLVV